VGMTGEELLRSVSYALLFGRIEICEVSGVLSGRGSIFFQIGSALGDAGLFSIFPVL